MLKIQHGFSHIWKAASGWRIKTAALGWWQQEGSNIVGTRDGGIGIVVSGWLLLDGTVEKVALEGW